MVFEDENNQDDMTLLQMCLAIEQSFGIEFTDTEISNLDTIDELIILIQYKRKKPKRRKKL